MRSGPVWSSDINVPPGLAESLIEEQFPSLRPARLRPLAMGWDNWVYELGGRWVFRFPRRRVATRLLEREIRVLPRLVGRLPLPVPDPVWIGRPCERFPYPFAGYARLPGHPIQESAPADGPYDGWGRDLARFLRALHDLAPAALGLGRADLPERHLDLVGLADLAQERLDMAYARGLWVDPDPGGALSWARCHAGDVRADEDRPGTLRLVHGDLNFRNVLVWSPQALSAIVDFGDIHLGHPARDLAIVYATLPRRGREAFFDLYGPVSPTWAGLGRFVALFISLAVLVSADDLGERAQVAEALRSLERLAQEPG